MWQKGSYAVPAHVLTRKNWRIVTGVFTLLQTQWLLNSHILYYFLCLQHIQHAQNVLAYRQCHQPLAVLVQLIQVSTVCSGAHKPVFLLVNPEGRPGMCDSTLLSGISGLSFDSPFLSPLLFFCLVLLFCLVIFFLSCHFPYFFQKILKHLFSRLFCIALVEQLGDSW